MQSFHACYTLQLAALGITQLQNPSRSNLLSVELSNALLLNHLVTPAQELFYTTLVRLVVIAAGQIEMRLAAYLKQFSALRAADPRNSVEDTIAACMQVS